jgi:putrescine transport system permease protein
MLYRRYFWQKFILFMLFLFIYFPILYLIIFSFNDSKLQGIWIGFSYHWYYQLFQNTMILKAIQTSFEIATLSATGSIILAIIAALSYEKFYGFKKQPLLFPLITTTLVIPEVVLGLSLLILFLPITKGALTVICAHMTLTTSYVFMLLQKRFQDMDHSLEEAALDLGAKSYQVFFKITLPCLMPSLLSGWLLAFVLSLDDVVIASFVGGPGVSTLPILTFSQLKTGITPEINCLCTFVVGIMSFGLLVWSYVLRHQQNHR